MKVAWNCDLVRKKDMFVDSTEARPHSRTAFKIVVWCVYPCVNGCAQEVAYVLKGTLLRMSCDFCSSLASKVRK